MEKGSPPFWRLIQKENFTRLEPLLQFLEISDHLRSQIISNPKFSLNLPRRLAQKMGKNTLDDPILRQFVPLNEEKEITPGFVLDPVEDQSFCKTGKLLKKYQSRALILTTSACAMHCRFCFRQNFPYETETAGFSKEIALLEKDPTIEEVILSGGDPLSLSDGQLQALLKALEKIPSVQRIRFHTRFPIGIPERIDDSFLSLLEAFSKQIFFCDPLQPPQRVRCRCGESIRAHSETGDPCFKSGSFTKRGQ